MDHQDGASALRDVVRMPELNAALALADRVAALGAEGRAWLEVQLGLAGELRPGRAAPEHDGGLSFPEQRLLERGTELNLPLWQNACVLHLRGDAAAEKADAAVRRAIMRHESLRTGYVRGDGGEVVPVVHATASLHLPRIDMRHAPAPEREAEAMRVIADDANRPFDRTAPPLFRSLLVQTGDDEMLLSLAAHELAADEPSLLHVAEEIAADCDGRPVAGPAGRYRDFAWRSRSAHGPQADAADGPRFHSERRTGGGAVPVPLDSGVAARLVALAASEGASVADAFLSVALSFLQSWSGESELAIAVSVPDRVIPADVVGARTHAVPLRVPVGTWMTFRALLRSVGDAAATAGQQGAFDGLPAEVVYSFRDIAHPAIEVLSHGRRGIARASLAFAATRTPDGVSMSLEYDASTYDAGQAAQLGAQLSNVARAASLDPDRLLGALELLTADDHARLAAWTTAAMPLPQDRTLHELLSRHAAARGSAVAIVAGETELTYAEWEARANQLARLLAARGVCAEGRVALLLPRSPEFLVALMAVWKAGAAFVPMDPEQPRARLDAVLANAGVQCAVTLELHADVVGDVPVILLDRDADDIAAESTAPLAVRSDPEDLAYIIYTSGSTGVPKGVMVPHRGLPNLAEAARRIHGLTPESRVALFGSFSFDASIADVAMALAPGATLCILPTRELAGEALLDALRRDRATIVTIPPSVLATVPFGPLPDLETLIVAGEACPLELARQWGRGRRLHNCYGPTEATVWATWERFDDEGTLGIGVPVPNTRVHVLDRMLRPVAPGLTGELFLGGINVARAYARQPALTAERFVPDPFAEQPGMRLYRTGDLVRHRPDGRLEFLGRADDQVKIRGWRIEPGEVAAMLRHHPDVTNAAVVAAAGRDGSTQLAACVTVRGAVTADAIRAWTRERLPGPMVPSAIAIVEAIPLSPNGKIDRDAVRRMARHSAPTEQFVAGESTEAALVAIWNELLDRPPASAGDNFFDLGGHSLLATRLLARVRQALDVDIPLRAFFENPTIAGMARSIREPEVRR